MGFVQSTSVLLIGLSWGFASAAAQDGEGLRVFVHSTVAQDTVNLAEPEARHIVERAGVGLIWVNCGSDDPCEAADDSQSVVLLIVKETGKGGLGCSFVSGDGGVKAIIGLGNIERLSASSKISKSQILAAVIANEIAISCWDLRTAKPGSCMGTGTCMICAGWSSGNSNSIRISVGEFILPY